MNFTTRNCYATNLCELCTLLRRAEIVGVVNQMGRPGINRVATTSGGLKYRMSREVHVDTVIHQTGTHCLILEKTILQVRFIHYRTVVDSPCAGARASSFANLRNPSEGQLPCSARH